MANTDLILLGVNSKAAAGTKDCSVGECSGDAQQIFGLLLGQMLGIAAPNAPLAVSARQATPQADQAAHAPETDPAAAAQVMLPDIEGAADQKTGAKEAGTAAAGKKQASAPGTAEEAGDSLADLFGQALERHLRAADGADNAAAELVAPEFPARSAQTGSAPTAAGQADPLLIQGAAQTPQNARNATSPSLPASTPPPAAHAAPDPGAKFADQVVHASVEGNKLAVTIEPKGLGTMDINLSLDRGVVHAQVQVAQDNARQLIESNLQQLLDALSREGISLGGFNISLKNHDGAWRQAPGNGRDRNGSDHDGQAAIAAAGHRHAEPGRLSIYA